MTRYRFIVARGNERLYERLVRSLMGLEDLEVIMDRRVGERRRPGGGGPGAERRRSDRRMQTRVDEELRTWGWSFIRIERR